MNWYTANQCQGNPEGVYLEIYWIMEQELDLESQSPTLEFVNPSKKKTDS